MINHDVKAGPLFHCQICGSNRLRQIIDLGHQPPCDSLLTAGDLHHPEITYPLRLNQCESCSLAQLDYVIPATKVYPPDYPYRAGISWPVVAAHEAMAKNLVGRFGVGFSVDIGSNDGTLLGKLMELGCVVMGIEPTDIADIARKSGIPTVKDFFRESIALNLAQSHGYANLITMTNVFAHMADLGEVMRGICALLAEDGVLVIENHYLLDILEKNQFDSIYHEHIRTYTLRSLMRLFAQYGMEIFDVERMPRYGGNIRVYVARENKQKINSSVKDLLLVEESSGLYNAVVWGQFTARVNFNRSRFAEFADKHWIYGCSAPGRASTLLNYFGVTRLMMPWTGEIRGSLKIGKYIPGCHIEIVDNHRIIEEQPEYLVLLAWHYGNEIEARLRKEGVRSKLILPLPEFEIREHVMGLAA